MKCLVRTTWKQSLRCSPVQEIARKISLAFFFPFKLWLWPSNDHCPTFPLPCLAPAGIAKITNSSSYAWLGIGNLSHLTFFLCRMCVFRGGWAGGLGKRTLLLPIFKSFFLSLFSSSWTPVYTITTPDTSCNLNPALFSLLRFWNSSLCL